MPKASPLQSNFNGGEYSALVQGRVESDRYKIGLATCLNYIPTIQGGLPRRPGTQFVAEVKDSTKATRLVRFEFSTTQAYILEFGDLYIRFYRDNGQIVETGNTISTISQASPALLTYTGADPAGLATGQEVYLSGVAGMTQVNGRNFKIGSVNTGANTYTLLNMDGTNFDATALSAGTGGTAERVYTVTSTYTEAQLFSLGFVQSADVLYITHPSHPPRKLTRTGHTSWTLTAITFLDGPYLALNTTATTLTLSGTTGSVTVTASDITGINSDTGFQTTDVGRLIRWKDPAGNWTWLTITAYTSTTVVTATISGANASATTATRNWRLGVWSDTTGYPAVATFHEDRLCFAGATGAPQRIDMSNTGDYENFAPTLTAAATISGVTLAAGDIISSNACNFTLNSNDVNNVRWLVSEEKALLAGTPGGEWVIRPSVQSEGISQDNINAKQVSSFGSSAVQPVIAGKSTIYVQRSGKKVRELSYFYEVDGFRSPDRTVLASHIAGETGFKQMAHQREPQSLVWGVRNDGVLAAMTYEREDDALVVGWHRHIFGGFSDLAESDPDCESVAVIPSTDGTRDEPWFIVKRRINGRTVRLIEYMTKFFEETDEQREAYFVDCGLTYDSPLTVTALTAANPAVMTATAHGFSNGDYVLVSEVLGFEDSDGTSGVNDKTFIVRSATTDTFRLEGMDGVNVDGTGFTAYVSGGQVRKYVTAISGLWHLEGQTVDIAGDGAIQPTKTVTNGAITLSTRATTVHVGFSYNSDGKQLRLEAGAADGTALGKTRRTHRASFQLHRTLGLSVGKSFDDLKEITFRVASDPDGRAPGLFSGIKSIELDFDYDRENQICWRQSRPVPGMILAIAPQLHTEDRG